MKHLVFCKHSACFLGLLAVGAAWTRADAAGPDEGGTGSLLIFPKIELRWDQNGNLIQDVFLRITGDFPEDVHVLMYFVNGDPPLPAAPPEPAHMGWNNVDCQFMLTDDQPTYWSVLTGLPGGCGFPFTVLDPGAPPGRPDPDGDPNVRVLRGFVAAWAVDNATKHEISWNHLKGDATIVNYQDGFAWEYGAYSFATVSATQGAEPDGVPGQLLLDGVEYDSAFDTLLFDYYASGSTALSGGGSTVTANGELIVMPASVDLRQDSAGPVTTKLSFHVYNQNELPFPGMERCITCWDQSLMSNYSLPNYFLSPSLLTDVGHACVDGVASITCSDPIGGASEDAALLAVHANRLAFSGPNPRDDSAGSTVVGVGQQSAVILYDIVEKLAENNMPGEGAPSPGDASMHLNGLLFPQGAESALVPADLVRLNRKGSVLIFPKVELKWDILGNLTQDTFIQLDNDSASGSVRALMVFVNGDPPLGPHPGWNHVEGGVVLTNNQPTYWSASSGLPAGTSSFTALDPGSPPGRADPEGTGMSVLRGFLVVWAADANDEEIHWNHLSGRATVVNYSSGYAWDYPAYAFRAVSGVEGGPTNPTPKQLLLNGVEYDSAFDRLIYSFEAVGAATMFVPGIAVGNDTELVLMPLDLDLTAGSSGPILTLAKFDVWNENEVRLSGMQHCVSCWDQQLVSGYPILDPNYFLLDNLQTNAGKARVEGVAEAACPGSVAAAMVGAAARRLLFSGSQTGKTAAGTALAGTGTQSAAIVHDFVACTGAAQCDDANVLTFDQCTNGFCIALRIAYGDVDGAGPPDQADLDDILCTISGFAGLANCPNADLHPPCTGDDDIDLDDILGVLEAFGGADPCA